MNSKTLMYTGIVLIAGLIGGYALIQSKQAGDISQSLTQADTVNIGKGQRRNQTEQPSRGNCLSDDCLYVDNLEYPAGELSPEAKDALDEAINDEYKALATYEAVIAKLGAVRPFSMIKGAEEQHIASLKAVYDKYGLIVPENSWASKVTAPSTLKEACQIGVDAEIANAKLYKDKLLPAVSQYVDIENVFTNLMNASEEKHLPAFERCN